MPTKSSVTVQTDEFLEFVTTFMRHRRHMMNAMPEELIRRKEIFDKLRGEGLKRNADFDLYFRVATLLSENPEPLPMGEFSKSLDIPLSTATRVVDGLVDSGFAARIADPEDRRVVRVALTKEGLELFQGIYNYIREGVSVFLGRLTADERSQLLSLLRKAVGDGDESGNWRPLFCDVISIIERLSSGRKQVVMVRKKRVR